MPVIVLLIIFPGQVYAEQREQYPDLYQIASLAMFQTGEYAGIISINEMKELGTIGIAGSDNLAGELIYLDDRVWQIDDEGVITEPPGDTGICLGSTITFEPVITLTLDKTMDTKDFFTAVNDSVPNHDIPYAFRFDGEFATIEVRSIPEQKEPYPVFSEVVSNQTVFNLTNVNGTIIGFWFPEWMKGVNYAGFHSHFITKDRTVGGHILNLTAKEGTAKIQPVQEFTVILPVGQG